MTCVPASQEPRDTASPSGDRAAEQARRNAALVSYYARLRKHDEAAHFSGAHCAGAQDANFGSAHDDANRDSTRGAALTERDPMPVGYDQLPPGPLPSTVPRNPAQQPPSVASPSAGGVLKLEGRPQDIADLVRHLSLACPPHRPTQGAAALASSQDSPGGVPSAPLVTDYRDCTAQQHEAAAANFGKLPSSGQKGLLYATVGFSAARSDGSFCDVQRVLLDSGANLCLVPEDLANSLGLTVQRTAAQLSTASGLASVVGRTQLTVRIARGQHSAQLPVPALVLARDAAAGLFQLLLGQPFLEAVCGVLDYGPGGAHFAYATPGLLRDLASSRHLQRQCIPLHPLGRGSHARVAGLVGSLSAALGHAFTLEVTGQEEAELGDSTAPGGVQAAAGIPEGPTDEELFDYCAQEYGDAADDEAQAERKERKIYARLQACVKGALSQ